MPSEKEHYYEYDIIRIIGMILVVMGHASYYQFTSQHGGIFYQLPETTSSFYYHFPSLSSVLFSYIYGFHMPLFFLLSGASLALRPLDPFDTVFKKKLHRLIVPYFVTAFFFMLPVKYIGGYYSLKGLRDSYAEIPVGGESGHLWFLPGLFWALLLFVFLLKVTKQKSIFFVLILTAVIQFTAKQYFSFAFFGIKDGLCHVFWVALGYCFEKNRRNFKEYTNPFVLNIRLIFLTLLVLLDFRLRILHPSLCVIAVSYWIYLIALRIKTGMKAPAKSKVLSVLASSTFTVYLLHDPLEYIILRLAFGLGWLTSVPGCILYYFLRSAGVYIVCVAAFVFIKWVRKKYGSFSSRFKKNKMESGEKVIQPAG